MTQCNSLNVKLSNSQLNKLKSGIKNNTDITLNISSNVNGNSNVETNIQPKYFINWEMRFVRFCKAFANNSLANIKLSTTQLSNTVQSGGFQQTSWIITRNWCFSWKIYSNH